MTGEAVEVRDYVGADERSWLRCRVLAFLDTDYFDDVLTAKPAYDGASVELVAIAADRGELVGVLDVAIEGPLATIETIAVHPDAARQGVGRQLLTAALDRLPAAVETIDAWTREDVAANRWYVANGFRETFRYLHVYAAGEGVPSSRPDLTPVAGFFHAAIEDEDQLREEFARVYVCRRYERSR